MANEQSPADVEKRSKATLAAVRTFAKGYPEAADPTVELLGVLLMKFLEVHGPERMLAFCEGMALAEERRRKRKPGPPPLPKSRRH